MYKNGAIGSFIIFILSLFIYFISSFLPVNFYDFYFYTDNKKLADNLNSKYSQLLKSYSNHKIGKYLALSYNIEKNGIIVKEDKSKLVLSIFEKDYDFLAKKLGPELKKYGYSFNIIQLADGNYMLYINKIYPCIKPIEDSFQLTDKIRDYLNKDDINNLANYLSNYVDSKYVKDIIDVQQNMFKKGFLFILDYYKQSYKKDIYTIKIFNVPYISDDSEILSNIIEIYTNSLKTIKPFYYKSDLKLKVTNLNTLERNLKKMSK
ncbi:MAG: hypothetical protein ACP5RD_03770 [bacterium]